MLMEPLSVVQSGAETKPCVSGFKEFFPAVGVGCMFLLVFDWLAVMFFSEELGVTLGFL